MNPAPLSFDAHKTDSPPPRGPGGATLPAAGRAGFGQGAASALSMRWAALHDAAGVVAMLAGVASEAMGPELRNFPAVMRDAGGRRRDMAEQGVDDLAAIMEPGLAALLAVHARGADPRPPAMALWQEFDRTRSALLALTPPPSIAPPMRRFT